MNQNNYRPQPTNNKDLVIMRRIDQLNLDNSVKDARMLSDPLVRGDVCRTLLGILMKLSQKTI
jgi:hypothetical protein